MTWLRLVLFAVISGIITGLIALWVPEGNSFRQIAVTFEAWIVLATYLLLPLLLAAILITGGYLLKKLLPKVYDFLFNGR